MMHDLFDGSDADLIEEARAAFEADAKQYGFDLMRYRCAAPEPWSQYANEATGHRWCGWLAAIAELKALQKTEAQQLRKIHPLDFPLEVFLADMTTRPANIIRAELAGFASYSGTGTFDIEPPFTVRHLCMFSRREMRKWPNFGRKCLNEVEEMLRARGLQLWENHDERSLRLLREHKEYFK